MQARAVLVLGAVLAMDGADKGTTSIVAADVKGVFGVDNTAIGLLVSVVALGAAVFTVPVGLLTDRVRRTRLLTASTALWVAATALAGFAPSYVWLLSSRAALGAVTATAGPTVTSLTGDFFPARARARMLGFVLGGELLGTGAGYAVSSVFADTLGWRFAFWWLVVPGLLLVRAVARLPEPDRAAQRTLHTEPAPGPRGGATPAAAGGGPAGEAAARAGARPDARLVLHRDPRRRSRWWTVRYVLRVRTNLVLIVASALGYSYFAGLRSFATLFVTDRYGVSTSVAGLLILTIGAGSLAGVFTGGRLADRLLRRGWTSARIAVPVVALAGVPLLVAPAMYTGALSAALPLFLLGAALLGAVNPPLDAARLDVLHAYMWGTGEGVRTVLRTLGEAAAPALFGYVSSRAFGGDGAGLQYTLMLFLAVLFAAALLGCAALRTYPRDVATAGASAQAIRAGQRAET